MSRYDAPPNAASQCGRILRLLESRRGEWIALPEILSLKISQYGTRVKELRDNWGFQIENKVETVDTQRHSWFRLMPSPAANPAPSPDRFDQSHHEDLQREVPLFADQVRP